MPRDVSLYIFSSLGPNGRNLMHRKGVFASYFFRIFQCIFHYKMRLGKTYVGHPREAGVSLGIIRAQLKVALKPLNTIVL